MSDWAKLRELAEAATPGPWGNQYDGRHTDYMVCVDLPDDNTIIVDTCSAFNAAENAAFIAAANPTAVLALLDEIERLRDEVASLEENAVRMREYRFALEGIKTDGKGNPQ